MKNITKLVEARGFILENEIITLKSRLSRGVEQDADLTYNYAPVAISPEQTEKGLSWLLNQWKTPAGKERKNNPFGYREQDILDNFDRFALVDFYDAGRFCSFFVPVYRVISRSGASFEYYYNGGQIQIIG